MKPTLFKNKYRIESARLKNWDYGKNGLYFITIKTFKNQPFFGKIVEKKMQLSDIGILAEKFWQEIPEHFPHVKLFNFVIMPDHTHGIIMIDKLIDNDDSTNKIGDIAETLHCNVSTGVKNQFMAQKSPKSGSISTIIRSYKSVVSKHARKINPNFEWQSRFHDSIIWNKKSFERIQNYITNNPANF